MPGFKPRRPQKRTKLSASALATPFDSLVPVDRVNVLPRARQNDPRWGHHVSFATQEIPRPTRALKPVVSILGCPDDTGVRLNYGRSGASKGPESIRKQFYAMTLPMHAQWEESFELWDLGDIRVENEIAQTHKHLERSAQWAASFSDTVIILGGGHDFAAPGIRGAFADFGRRPNVLNVDVHLDVRPLEKNLPHSGCAMRLLTEEKKATILQFGAQSQRNSKSAFAFCKKNGIPLYPYADYQNSRLPITAQLRRFLSVTPAPLHALTMDIDACHDGSGVSAPTVLGFSALELVSLAAHCARFPSLRYLELAEVAPECESLPRSSQIAAQILWGFLEARFARAKKSRR